MMRHRFAVGDQIGDQILAEIVGGIGVGGVAAQFLDEELGVEDIDAHAA